MGDAVCNYPENKHTSTLPETNIAHENRHFPDKYHQHGWIFHGYVSLQECIPPQKKDGWKGAILLSKLFPGNLFLREHSFIFAVVVGLNISISPCAKEDVLFYITTYPITYKEPCGVSTHVWAPCHPMTP